MTSKVQKWGNSLAVRVPKELAQRFDLKAGSQIKIVEEKGGLTIKPIMKKTFTLRELAKGITEKNRHKLIDWGGPVGKEVW